MQHIPALLDDILLQVGLELNILSKKYFSDLDKRPPRMNLTSFRL